MPLPLMMGGGVPPVGYQVKNSLRFRSAGSTYLQLTLTTSSTTSGSLWHKRGKLGTVSPILDSKIYFNASDQLVAFGLTSNAVYRDPAAWYQLFWNSSGVWLGVNNGALQQVTGTGTYTPAAITNPRLGYDGTNYLDGYVADFAFYNGSSVSQTGGKTDSNGNYAAALPAGSKTSYLTFQNASALGTDSSGNGNNWTVNNFTASDQMTDTPTNNYATLNPLKPNSAVTLSNGNLTASGTSVSGTNYLTTLATIGVSSGKWYWEVGYSAGASAGLVGIATGDIGLNPGVGANPTYTGSSVLYLATGSKSVNNSSSSYGVSWTTGDIIGIALDMDAGTIAFYKNNVPQGTAYTGLSGIYFPLTLGSTSSGTLETSTANFGQSAFTYTPPTGFKALCTANLPNVAVKNPSNGFQSLIGTGANIESKVAAASTAWAAHVDIYKDRSNAEVWHWRFSYDSAHEYAVSTTSCVYQAKATLTAADNYVGYTINVGNTYGTAAGSIGHTSGAATTVTHGVGTSNCMIFLFNRTSGTTIPVYHPSLSAGNLLDLCSAAGQAASTAITNVTATTFDIGSGVATGTFDWLVISALSGFCALGKYSGNGSADGAFGYSSLRPGCVWTKRTDTGGYNFDVFDHSRDPSNVSGARLTANTSDAETGAGAYPLDILSNGFKWRGTNLETNASGGTYAYLLFAEAPFGGGNVSPACAR